VTVVDGHDRVDRAAHELTALLMAILVCLFVLCDLFQLFLAVSTGFEKPTTLVGVLHILSLPHSKFFVFQDYVPKLHGMKI